MKRWIVVADSAAADIYAQPERDAWELVKRLENEAAHERTQDLTSDLPGRSFDRRGRGRHAMEPPTDPKRHAAERFARAIATFLEHARGQQAFEALTIIAPPAFLGALRESLSRECSARLDQTIGKNLTHCSERELRDHLASS